METHTVFEVEEACRGTLEKWGFSEGDAKVTANHLIEGTLRGYGNHGIARISEIRRAVLNGCIDPAAKPTSRSSGLSFEIFDGHGALGPPLGYAAIDKAMEFAENSGVGLVGLLNCSHMGILAPFVERAAEKGFCALMISQTEPAAVIPGGKTKLVGTNPLAYACPSVRHFCVDISSTQISRGSLLQHKASGTLLPPNCAVDANGTATRDPRRAVDGGLTVLGAGLKGMFVNMLLGYLAGPLIGGLTNDKVRGTRFTEVPSNKGDFFLVFNVARISAAEKPQVDWNDFLTMLTEDSSLFHVPGSISRSSRAANLSRGISLSSETSNIIFN